MNYYELWMEGYSATGQSCGASFLGKYYCKTFKEAIKIWIKEDYTERSKYICYKTNRFWRCQIFENEMDARRNFG